MADEDKENQQGDVDPDIENDNDEDFNIDDNVDEIEDVDKLREIAKNNAKIAKTEFARKKHFRQKAQNAQQKPKEEPQPKEEPKPEPQHPKQSERIDRLEESEAKRDFGYRNKLSPEEVDQVFSYAKGQGKKPSEVLDSPFVKAGIQEMRNQTEVDNATPAPSSGGGHIQVEGKTYGEMSEKERREHHQKVMNPDGKS